MPSLKYKYTHYSFVYSFTGNKNAAAPAITIVKNIIFTPDEIELNPGTNANRKLANIEMITRFINTLLPLVGGIITAINIPYKAILNALVIRSGKAVPDTTPKIVP